MGDNKTSHNNNTDMPKDEEKVLHNNNNFGRGGAGGISRGRGYNRGIGHLAQNRGRFQIMNRGRGQDYRYRGQAANARGRYGYSNNWRRGRAYGWYTGHNSQFYKPRMINTGPWSAASAYRHPQQPRVDSQCSTRPIQTKILVNPSTEFNPQIPPPSYYNSYPQGYLQPSPECSYYHPQAEESHGCAYYHPQAGASTNCTYYHPQAGASHGCSYYHPQAGASHPQAFVSDSASGLVVVDNRGQMYNYQGGSFVEVEDNTLPVVAQDSSILQVVAQMPRPEVLETAMSGLGLASSGGMQSSSSGGSNINGEKPSNNNQGEEIPGEEDGAGEVLSYNPEISKNTAYMKSSAGDDTNLMEPLNKPGQDTGVAVHEGSAGTGGAVHEGSAGTGGAVHLATVANPLSLLGQAVEQDKQLVETFAGVEMRPVSPFPPNYGLQYFFVPYGTPPPQHVIPVMVFPVLPIGHNPEANQVTQGREADVEDDQVKQNGLSTRENEFPPPRSLLPSYMGNMDLPYSPLLDPTPVEIYQSEPSPVEIYQPFTNPWPHQFMMDPLAPNVLSDVSLQIHQSRNENRQ